ncbi:hypothetical protein [Pseudoalteromonas viridis]|uniref:Uncharacterized protein n=1 Tax=Pseudoalteromonas viridis TaxID=339617 RepID=A0ABX7V8B3_9GAMM|nr:hypothetical protein [Pseudoalteromonas viridis]QTL34744.1 hypothetical protein J5X90_14550 [Pseudoalteromonas viridis]
MRALDKRETNPGIILNFLVNLSFLILCVAVSSAQAQFLVADGNSCPTGFHLASAEEVKLSHSEACVLASPGEALRLSGLASIAGASANCDIKELDLRILERSLCQSNNIQCADNEQLVRGQTVPDFCARVDLPEDLTSWDLAASWKCHENGNGGFSHFQYLHTPPSELCSAQSVITETNILGRVVEFKQVFGTKTLLCDDKVQPAYNEAGKIVACPFGSELVKGHTAEEHCAFYWEDSGLNTNAEQVCKNLGGFKGYQYRIFKDDYLPKLPNTNQLCGPDGNMVMIPNGQKTIICNNEQLPQYDEFGELISCPAYTIRVNGHSTGVVDHCAFPEGHFWYGLSPELDENDYLVEEDICFNVARRGSAVRRVQNHDGSITLLCSKEDFAHPVATEMEVASDPSGLSCESKTQEYIAANRQYSGLVFRSHCAWLPDAEQFIAEGLDINGVDVCGERSQPHSVFKFAGYIYPGGVKTPDCQCEGGGCPSSQDSGRFKGPN